MTNLQLINQQAAQQ
jgi:hypothetical protein